MQEIRKRKNSMRGQDVRPKFNTWDQHGRRGELTPQVVLWPAHAHCVCVCTYIQGEGRKELKNKTYYKIPRVAEVNSNQITTFISSCCHTVDRLAPVQYLYLRNHYKPGFHLLKAVSQSSLTHSPCYYCTKSSMKMALNEKVLWYFLLAPENKSSEALFFYYQ